jgi:hypothetical protein
MSTATELLRRALESFDWMDVDNSVTDDIRAFLDAEPEAEPKTHEPWCAYLTQMLMSNPPQRSKCNCKNTTAPRPEFVRLSEEEVTKILTSAYDMYSTICAVENRLAEKNHPPRPEPAIRKPMTEEEIKMALLIRGFPYDAFRAGIRFAEKHHFGIGGDDE